MLETDTPPRIFSIFLDAVNDAIRGRMDLNMHRIAEKSSSKLQDAPGYANHAVGVRIIGDARFGGDAD